MTLTTPNVLTLCRIAMVPVLVWLLTFSGPVASACAGGAFLLATLSDYLDGYIARNYGSVSLLGKFLDPMADKLVVCSALIMLVGLRRVPAWMVVVIVGREVAVTALRAMAAAQGVVLAAEELGKYKMTLQAMAVQALLIHFRYFHLDFAAAGMFLLWLAMIVSLWSGFDYLLILLSGFRLSAGLSGSRFDKRRFGG